MSKLEEVRTKCSFFRIHASRLESLVFPVALLCLWGKPQNLSFLKVSKQVVMSFCVCVARVPVSLWGLGVGGVFARRCVHGRNRPQPSATVRNRPCGLLYGRAYGKFCRRWSFLEVSNVSLLRFAWQAWHFVTFRRVL